MDIKQLIFNDRNKYIAQKIIHIIFNPVTNIVIGVVILFLVFNVVIKVYHYYNDNPYLLELQQIISEQYGTDFSVVAECSKDEKISMIVIESTDEIYLRKDIFSKVNKIQKIVFEYINKHQENFCDIDWFIPKSYEDGKEKKGVELQFENKDCTSSSGHKWVFNFYNNLEYKNENAEGFNSFVVIAGSDTPYSHYPNIKVSELVEFDDVNYISCCEICVDDATIIKR